MIHFPLKAAIFEGSLVAVAIALGWLLDSPPSKTFSFNLLDALWGIAAVLPPLTLFWACLHVPWKPLKHITQIINEIFVPLFRECRPMELAIISALAGLGEEMLFRGVVQAYVDQKIGAPHGPWLALTISAALFGLLHFVTPTYALLTGLIGLYLGWIWWATGNLLVPVVAHGVYDFLVLWYFVREKKRNLT
jgi:uncharacterized protein